MKVEMVAESFPSPAPSHRHTASISSTSSSPRSNHSHDQGRGKRENSVGKSVKFCDPEETEGGEPQQPVGQLRRCRTREVCSRYMFPTISSAAAAVATGNDGSPHGRRSSSPNGRRAKNGSETPNNNNFGNSLQRSVSVERRRPAKAEENGRIRGSAGLWPSSTINNAMPTLADQLGNERLKKKIEHDQRALAAKDFSSNSNVLQKLRVVDQPRNSISDKGNAAGNALSRSRTPERPRTPPRRSTDVENTKPSKENVQNGLPTSTGGKRFGVPASKSLVDANASLKAVARCASLNMPGRSIRNGELKGDLKAGTVNVENVSELLIPGRMSVDLERPMRSRSRRNYSADMEADASSSNSVNSDAGASTGEGDGENGKKKGSKKIIKGSYVPARFLQDTLSRLRRLSDAGHIQGVDNGHGHRGNKSSSAATANGSSSSSSSTGSWAMSPGRVNLMASMPSPQFCSSPIANGVRGKNSQSINSNFRGSQPPNPPKGASSGSRMSSMLNFGMELLKGKRSAAHSAAQEEVLHQLRLLQNRWLQWRFVNARAQAAHEAQIASAQNSIYAVWLKTLDLRSSVVRKRIQFQKARHEQKVNEVIVAHAAQLEDWASLEEEHESAVTGTMEYLDSAIVKVPLVGGAKADIRSVKQVMTYAVDVMHGIKGSANKFLAQAEKVDSLFPELAETVTRERALLQECAELIAGVASLEVEERSLRTHLIQLQECKSMSLGPVNNDVLGVTAI